MGSMFSGKSSELIRRLKRFQLLGKSILVINSDKDTRSSEEVVRTHDFVTFQCIKTGEIMHVVGFEDYKNADIVAVDEAQFFPNLRRFTETALGDNKTLVYAGLDGDYRQQKFGELLDCIPLADTIIKLKALCMVCRDGTPGPFTMRIVDNKDQILVGAQESHTASCRKHLCVY